MRVEPYVVKWDEIEIHLVPETDADYRTLQILAGNEKVTTHFHFDGSVTVVGEGD